MENSECQTIKTYDEFKLFVDHIFDTLFTASENLVAKTMIEEEIQREPEMYRFLDVLFSEEGKKTIVSLASKLTAVPETSDRVEVITGGSKIVPYISGKFKYDVFHIIAFIVSIVLVYIAFVRINAFYQEYNSAALRADLPQGEIDNRITFILNYFLSLIPGCTKTGDANFQQRILTTLTNALKRQIYDSMSLTTFKANQMCYTRVSDDPTSAFQLIIQGVEMIYDRQNINSCISNVMSNEFNHFVTNLTLDINVGIGKASGAINMLLTASMLCLKSAFYIKRRIMDKSEPQSAVVIRGGRRKRTRRFKKRNNKSRRNRRSKK